MFSIRIVTTSHYQATPIPGLDVTHSDFRDAKVPKVPVLRIFGSTLAGQKTCMHVHGVFPYLYVRYDGTQPLDRYLRQFAASLDKAINIGSRVANSNLQHVFKISLVSGIPMYGYHAQEEQFLKIYLYNPNNIRKAADLLLGGAVMNKPFQPHESHIPFPLQLFMDYNLYGMNLISVGALKFRKDSSGNDAKENIGDKDEKGSSSPSSSTSFLSVPTPILPGTSTSSSSSSSSSSMNREWNKETIPSEFWHPDNVERQSVCELEVDVVAADIINRHEMMNNVGKNPGLAALWEDERQRRRDAGKVSQTAEENSQEREGVKISASEEELLDKFLDMIKRQQELRDTQSTDDLEDSQTSVPASQVERHLSREDSIASSQSTVILDGEEQGEEGREDVDNDHPPIVSLDSIKKVVASSQSFSVSESSQKSLSDTQDLTVAGILAAILEEDAGPPSGQVAKLEEQDSILNATVVLDEDGELKEDEETVVMSQAVVLDTGQDEKEPPDLEEFEKYDDASGSGSPDIIMKTDDEDDEDDIDVLPQFDGASDKLSHPHTQQNSSSEGQTSAPNSSDAAMMNQQGFQYPAGMQQRGRSAQNYPSDANWTSQQQQSQSWHSQQQAGASGWQAKSPTWGSQHPQQQQHNYPHWQQQQQQQITSPGSQTYASPLHSTPTSPFQSPSQNPYASPSHSAIQPSGGYQSSSPSSSQHSFTYHSSPFHSPANNESYQSMYPRQQGYTQYSPGGPVSSYQSPTASDMYHSPTSSHPYKSPSSVYPSPTANQSYHLSSGSPADNMSPPSASQGYHRPTGAMSKNYPSSSSSSSGMGYPGVMANQGFRTPPVCQGNSPVYPQSSMYPQHSYQSSSQGSRYPSPSHMPSWSGRSNNPYNSGYFSPPSHQTSLSKVPDSPGHPNVPCSPDTSMAQGKMSSLSQSSYPGSSSSTKSGKKGSKEEQKLHPYQKQKNIQTPQNPGYARAVAPLKSSIVTTSTSTATATMSINQQKADAVFQGPIRSTESFVPQGEQPASQGMQLIISDSQGNQEQLSKNVALTFVDKKEEQPVSGSYRKTDGENKRSETNAQNHGLLNSEQKAPNPCATPMIQQLLMEDSPAKVNITPPSLEDKNCAMRKPMLSPTLPTTGKGKKKSSKGKGAKQGLRQRSASLTSPPSIPGYGGVFRPQTMPNMAQAFGVNSSNRPHSMSFSQMGCGYPRKPEATADLQKQLSHSESLQQQHFSPVNQWQQQQHQWGGQQWQQDYAFPGASSGENEKKQDSCPPSSNIPGPRMHQRSYSADCASFVYSPNDPSSSSSSVGGQLVSPQPVSSNESNRVTPQPETGSFIDNTDENGTLSSLLGLMTEDGLWDVDGTPCLVNTFGQGQASTNQPPSLPKCNPLLEAHRDSPDSKDFITLEPATKYKSDTGMTSSEESDRMDFEIAADLIPVKIPGLNPTGTTNPRVGKQGRMKTMDILCRDIVYSDGTNPSYTYTFHVPTPLFKRLKFYKSAQARKHDLKVLRMHPMDARKYSLLKIGKEIVNVAKLTEEDLAKYNLTLPLPGDYSHSPSDGPFNRVNLDIPLASSSRSSGSSHSDDGLSSYDTDFPPNKVAPPSSLPSGQVLPPARNIIRPTTPPSSSSNMPWPRQYPMAPSGGYQMAVSGSGSGSSSSNSAIGSGSNCYNTFPPSQQNPCGGNPLMGNDHSQPMNPYVSQAGRENYLSGQYLYHQNGPSLRNNSIPLFNGQNSEMASTSSFPQGTHSFNSGHPPPYNNSSVLYPYQQPPQDGRIENGMANTVQNQKNGLRSPGQHGPTDTIDVDRLSGCGDRHEDDDATMNTTKACPVNARVKAQIRSAHAKTLDNNELGIYHENQKNGSNMNKESYENRFMNRFDLNDRHWSEPIRSCHDTDLTSPRKHRRSRRKRNRRLSLKRNRHRLEGVNGQKENEQNISENSLTSFDTRLHSEYYKTSNDTGRPNSDLVIKIKTDHSRHRSKRKDKNWKSLRLTIPKQNFAPNVHWTDIASNADSGSFCSSQKESDGDAEMFPGTEEGEEKEIGLSSPYGVRQSMRQAKLRSMHQKYGSDTNRPKERKKKQSLKEGVHYIVIGKFKGHQKMLIKIPKVPVGVKETVKADDFLGICERDVVRSASTNSESGECLNSDGTSHSVQIVVEDTAQESDMLNTAEKNILDESPFCLSVDSHENMATSPETPFFCQLKKTFIKRQGGKGWINVSHRTKKKNNVFFPGVLPRMFIRFQATFHDNISKLEESQEYSSSSDDEDDYLEDIILKGKVQHAKEIGFLKDSIMERLTQTETISLANIPSKISPDVERDDDVNQENVHGENMKENRTEFCLVEPKNETKSSCQQTPNTNHLVSCTAKCDDKYGTKIIIKKSDRQRCVSPFMSRSLKSDVGTKTDEGDTYDELKASVENMRSGKGVTYECRNVEKIDSVKTEVKVKSSSVLNRSTVYEDVFSSSEIVPQTKESPEDRKEFMKRQMAFYEDISSDPDTDDTIVDTSSTYNASVPPASLYDSNNRYYDATWALNANYVNKTQLDDSKIDQKDLDAESQEADGQERESDAECDKGMEMLEIANANEEKEATQHDSLPAVDSKQNKEKRMENVCQDGEETEERTISNPILKGSVKDSEIPKDETPQPDKAKKSKSSKKKESKPVSEVNEDLTPNTTGSKDASKTKGVAKKKKKREMEWLGGFGTSSNDEKEGNPFPTSKRLRQRKQTMYTYHMDGIDSSSSSGDEDINDPVFFQHSQPKAVYPNKKQNLDDKNRSEGVEKVNKPYPSRAVRGKRKKGAGSNKLLNSLSLLHMATLANLTESQDSPASPASQEPGETNYSDQANNDHCQEYNSSLETMSFTTPPDQENNEVSPPLAFSPAEKLTKIKRRNQIKKAANTSAASCRALNFQNRHRNRVKPGSNGSANLGTRPFSMCHVVSNSASSSPVPANFFHQSSLEATEQPANTVKSDKNILELETAKAMSLSMKQILRMAMTDDSMDSDSKDGVAMVKPRESKRAQVKSTSLSMSDIMKMTSANSVEIEENTEVRYTILTGKKDVHSGGGTGKAEVKDVALSFKDIIKMNEEADGSDDESCSSIPKPLFSNDVEEDESCSSIPKPLFSNDVEEDEKGAHEDQCEDVKNSSFNLVESSFAKSSTSPSDTSINTDNSLPKPDTHTACILKESCAIDINIEDVDESESEKQSEDTKKTSEKMETSVKRAEDRLKLQDTSMIKCLSPLSCIIEESQIARISQDEVTSGEPDTGMSQVPCSAVEAKSESLEGSNPASVDEENLAKINDNSPEVIEPSQEVKQIRNIPIIKETLIESESTETEERSKDTSCDDHSSGLNRPKTQNLLHPLQIPSFSKGTHTLSSSSSGKAHSDSSHSSYPWCWQWQPQSINEALNSPLNLSTSGIKATTVYSPITPTSPISSPYTNVYPPLPCYNVSSQENSLKKTQSPPAKKSKPLWYPWLSKEETKAKHTSSNPPVNMEAQEQCEDLSVSKKSNSQTHNESRPVPNGHHQNSTLISGDHAKIRNWSNVDRDTVTNYKKGHDVGQSSKTETLRDSPQRLDRTCISDSNGSKTNKRTEETKKSHVKTQRGLKLSECESVSQFVGSVIETAYKRKKVSDKEKECTKHEKPPECAMSETDLTTFKQNDFLSDTARHRQQYLTPDYPTTSLGNDYKMLPEAFYKNGLHSSFWDFNYPYNEQVQNLNCVSSPQSTFPYCGKPQSNETPGNYRRKEDERVRTMLENEKALRDQFRFDSNPQTPCQKPSPHSPGSSNHLSLTDRLVTELIKGDRDSKEQMEATGGKRRGQKRSQGKEHKNETTTSSSTGKGHGKGEGSGSDERKKGKGSDEGKREQTARPKPYSIGEDRAIVIHPQKRAPSRLSVENSLLHYGLNSIQVPVAFCSSVQDLPDKPVDAGGRVLSVPSKRVSELKEFESSPFIEGVKTTRSKSIASSGVLSSQSTSEPLSIAIDQDPAIRFMFGPDRPVIVAPCRLPPKRKSVAEWLHIKLMEVMKGKENVHFVRGEELQKEMYKRKDENRTKRKSVMFSQLPTRSDVDSSPEHSSTSPPLSLQSPSYYPEESMLIDTDLDTSRSPSQTPAPVKSPPQSSRERSSVKRKNPPSPSNADNQTEDSNTNSKRDKRKGKKLTKKSVDKKNPDQSSANASSTSFVSSTPVRRSSKDLFDPVCTPIASLNPGQRQDKIKEEEEEEVNPPVGVSTQLLKRISTNTENKLRRNILKSQPQRQFSDMGFSAGEVSQIEGPTPKNSFGFKVSMNTKETAKADHKYQCVTTMSVEVHVETRGDLRPNPDFDSVKAIFYSIFDDVPPERGQRNLTGVVLVDLESWHVITERNKRLNTSKTSQSDSQQDKPSTSSRAASMSSSTTKISPLSSPPLFTQSASVARTQTHSPKPSTSKARSPSPSPSKSAKGKGRKKTVPPPPAPKSVGCKALLERCALDGDLEVTYVQDETDLMLTLVDLVHRFDPDILVGFEIQMLSWGYLLQRAARLNLELCSKIARISGSKENNSFSADKDQWGADYMSEIHVVGRIVLNLWRILRHEVSLNTYTFENCAYHILHQRLPLFSFRDLTKWFAHNKTRWRVVDHYVSRVQGHLKMIDRLDLIGKTSEFARVFGIEFYDVLSRGSQIRVESMMLRLAKPMNYVPVSPNVNQRARQRAPECIALTLEPESKYYTSPVVVLDFQSLYPSIMIAYNYCFSTCLGRLDFLEKANGGGPIELGCTSLNIPPKLLKGLRSKVTISPNGIVFVKQSVRKGIISSMVEEILNTRLMVKKSMKDCKDDKALTKMLDARQLGLKLIANVTYGYTAASFSGRMPCVEVADSIVRKARESLERAIKLVEDTPRWGARVIYGDTDSLFIHFPGRTKDEAFVLGHEIADAVTAMFPSPMKLKFEKVYLPCVLETKKRYVGFMYETPDQKEPVFDAKGIETVRRDACSAVSKILERSIKVLFSTHDLSRVRSYVCRQLHKLLEGRVSLLDLVFAKEFRGMMGYKPGACIPSLEIARKRLRVDPCSEPRVGERVPYVIVHGSPGLPLIQLVREPQELLRDRTLRLNAVYYITKQILPPLDRLLSLVGISVFKWYNEMPKVVRVGHLMGVDTTTKQGTISQFFATSNCPVCDAQTKTTICGQCRKDAQLVVTSLNTKIRQWEATYDKLSQVCTSCQGTQDSEQSCISIDCPIVFRRHIARQDLHRTDTLNQALDKFLDF